MGENFLSQLTNMKIIRLLNYASKIDYLFLIWFTLKYYIRKFQGARKRVVALFQQKLYFTFSRVMHDSLN